MSLANRVRKPAVMEFAKPLPVSTVAPYPRRWPPVLITEPFGTRIPAIIDSFYADDQGEIWARLKPVEVNPDCRWEQACIRSQGLVKAE